jgi:predicted RNA-binding Zn ribbon-like protein
MNEIEARDHRHAGSVEATLEFLNTTELDGSGQWAETLPTLREAAGWLVGHGLLYPEEAGPLGRLDDTRQRDLLAHLHGTRAAIREVMESLVAGRPAADSAVAAVNGLLWARTVVELAQADGTLVARHRHVGDALEGALARLAEPLVDSVASGETGRLRICANDGCRWVFEDTSRTGRRRWCSMASCGNRAKAARHRARRRGQPPTAASVGP